MGLRVIGFDTYCLVERSDGVEQSAEHAKHGAAVVVGLGIAWFQFDGPVECPQCLLQSLHRE